MKIVRGTLEIRKITNGYVLYGKQEGNDPAILGYMGKGVDSEVDDPEYDPNTEADLLSEAYGFELTPGCKHYTTVRIDNPMRHKICLDCGAHLDCDRTCEWYLGVGEEKSYEDF